MIKKNDFEKLCDQLEKCNKKCTSNPIKCVKRYLRLYAKGDIDLLLKMKAEANGMRYKEFVLALVSMMALGVSTFSLLFNICTGNKTLFVIAICTVLIFLGGKLAEGIYKFSNVGKWQKYVLVGISEIEREYRKSFDS